MRVFLALLVGLMLGAGATWFLTTGDPGESLRQTGQTLEGATQPARSAIQEQIKKLELDPDRVKEELSKSGQVVRKRAQEAGQVIADATSDARITAAIKAKLVADTEVSALSISVNTTDGVVTLSGGVSSSAEISRAMAIAMETDGVREVISTLQIRARSAPK